MEILFKELEKAGMEIARGEPLKGHTSFRIGGPVEAMLFPKGEEAFIQAVKTLKEAGCDPLLIGNGSNLLGADGPISRVAVKTHDGVGAIRQIDDRTIYVSAGVLLSRAAVFARELGLSGLEFAHGIPGTLGGAVVMNAGAYGGEMAQVVGAVDVLDESTMDRQSLEAADLDFSYRHSRFSHTKDVVLGAKLTLLPGDPLDIQGRMEELARRRRTSQPLDLPSGGSTFKRPKEGYAAALIDGAGLKGYTVGGAQVSEKHAGFVVNLGEATCGDVLRLMDHVRERVFRQTGILLEPEIQLIQ